ncbi:MAG: hypothetical protein ACE5JG_06320 [Planctomycetota bacterium]
MIRTLTAFLLVGVLATGALAQGAGPGGTNPTLGQQLKDQFKNAAMSGTGFTQQNFMNTLQTNLNEQFGDKTGTQYLQNFQQNGQRLQGSDMVGLMNGNMPTQKVQDLFGASSQHKEGLQSCIEKCVQDKDRKMFFGVIIVILVDAHDMDPGGDFVNQVAGARDEMPTDLFERFTAGSVSKNNIKEGFGFTHKDDLKLMQGVLNEAQDSPFMDHPLAQSLGMGNSQQFDASKLPQMGPGMAGFGQFQNGQAGGMPMPQDLPPMPFMGGSADSGGSGRRRRRRRPGRRIAPHALRSLDREAGAEPPASRLLRARLRRP